MTVRCRFGRHIGSEYAVSARPVVNDDLLAPCGREILADEPREYVGCAARHEGDQNANRLRRVIFSVDRRRQRIEQPACAKQRAAINRYRAHQTACAM